MTNKLNPLDAVFVYTILTLVTGTVSTENIIFPSQKYITDVTYCYYKLVL